MIVKRLWPTLILASILAGCDSTGTIGLIAKSTADVRVLNASATNLDVLQDQAIDQGMPTSHLGPAHSA